MDQELLLDILLSYSFIGLMKEENMQNSCTSQERGSLILVMLLKPEYMLKMSQKDFFLQQGFFTIIGLFQFRQQTRYLMHYDPMIAKLVVWGENRAAALVKLKDCLSKFQVCQPI